MQLSYWVKGCFLCGGLKALFEALFSWKEGKKAHTTVPVAFELPERRQSLWFHSCLCELLLPIHANTLLHYGVHPDLSVHALFSADTSDPHRCQGCHPVGGIQRLPHVVPDTCKACCGVSEMRATHSWRASWPTGTRGSRQLQEEFHSGRL